MSTVMPEAVTAIVEPSLAGYKRNDRFHLKDIVNFRAN